MDPEIKHLIEEIHRKPEKLVMAVSGPGTQAVSWLMQVPGASKTVMEVTIPYSESAATSFVGHDPSKYVTQNHCQEMAKTAYRRAVALREVTEPVVGLSCTGSITTNRVRKGKNQCFICVWAPNYLSNTHLVLAKNLRERIEEENLVSTLLIKQLGEALGINHGISLNLSENDKIDLNTREYASLIESIAHGQIQTLLVKSDTEMVPEANFTGAIIPGSFNPLHSGHIELANVAEKTLGLPVAFELSAINVDKPTLGATDINARIKQFDYSRSVFITGSPLFSDKARIFPNCTFVIGWDTAHRILNKKYYKNNTKQMLDSLNTITQYSCNFLVAGRVDAGKFRSLSEIDIPPPFQNLFTELPENEFRVDMSSTDIRQTPR